MVPQWYNPEIWEHFHGSFSYHFPSISYLDFRCLPWFKGLSQRFCRKKTLEISSYLMAMTIYDHTPERNIYPQWYQLDKKYSHIHTYTYVYVYVYMYSHPGVRKNMDVSKEHHWWYFRKFHILSTSGRLYGHSTPNKIEKVQSNQNSDKWMCYPFSG
jgi:hypothetical protein